MELLDRAYCVALYVELGINEVKTKHKNYDDNILILAVKASEPTEVNVHKSINTQLSDTVILTYLVSWGLY